MPRLRFRAHQVNDVLCEVGIEFAAVVLDTIGAVCAVRRHDVGDTR